MRTASQDVRPSKNEQETVKNRKRGKEQQQISQAKKCKCPVNMQNSCSPRWNKVTAYWPIGLANVPYWGRWVTADLVPF